MKDRHAVDITHGQRSALILFDGHRSVRDVLEATGPLGVTTADIDALVSRGLLQPAEGGTVSAHAAPAVAAAPSRSVTAPAPATPAAAPGGLTDEERVRRYRIAYPLATELTAKLGFKSFRLNMAVEAAHGYEGLLELMPRIRAATSDVRLLRPLEDALAGRG